MTQDALRQDAPIAERAVAQPARLGIVLVCAIFFLSGFPALIYQLVWQRSLFTIYGTNIESVTIVVTGFLLGLGLGSLAGGYLSKLRPLPLLVLFGIAELAIGTFGIFSLKLFAAVGAATLHAQAGSVMLVPLLLLLVPTLLMGSTLPLLTQHLVERLNNVGRSVGLLYFLNTLGSAVACFVVALWMMRTLGMQGSITLAAACNAIVGCGALVAYLNDRGSAVSRRAAVEDRLIAAAPMRFGLALALAAAVAWLSLSYEIIWFRVFSFATGGSALAFALVLGAFLFGVAFGSLAARALCRAGASHTRQMRALGLLIVGSALLGCLYFPMTSAVATFAGDAGYAALMLLLVAVGAGLMGAIFPLLSHLGIAADRRAGSRLSQLYLANILGSVGGSLATGFVLMDMLGIAAISILLGAAGLALGAVVLIAAAPPRAPSRWIAGAGAVLAGLILVAGAGPIFDNVYGRALFRAKAATTKIVETVETRHGVINVTDDKTVYGGGMYDGIIHVGLVEDVNRLERPFALSLLHAAPKQVLMVGLATGSWAQVIANHPQLEKLTVIEINPGYLGLIREHEEAASLLRNPKVEIVIDDGRRWLNRHPERKFDAIVQNTTYHFRSNVTNLLSSEYIGLALDHLETDGVFLYNVTGSERAMRTACLVGSERAMRLDTAMVVGKSPLRLDRDRWAGILDAYRIDGAKVLDRADPRQQARFVTLQNDLAPVPPAQESPDAYLETCAHIMSRTAGLTPILDDNMGEEWEYIKSKKLF